MSQPGEVPDDTAGLVLILGAFAKFRKAAVSFFMSVLLKQLGSHWMDSHYILYLSIFRKSAKKVQVSLKSDRNNG
jgi:hypothetical protein